MLKNRAFVLQLLALLLLVGGVGFIAPAQDDQPPQRVILQVDRNLQIRGVLELEDDSVIVVRDTRGELHSYAKPKVSRIVRLVDPKPNQNGLIILTNGQMQEGVIIEDVYEKVVLEIEGIRSTFRRELVDHVMLEPTVEERYQLFKEQLTPTMHEQHFRLCQWLFEQQEYELTRTELLLLLGRADVPEARRLLTIVDAQITLEQREARSRTDVDAIDESDPIDEDEVRSGIVPPSELMPHHILTMDEVNLIRVLEIDFRTPPKIRIAPETVRTLIESYREDRRVPLTPEGQTRLFRDAADDPLSVLKLMFELRARELYGEVEVLSEPRALNLFRQRVHNSWLINNCATTRCHGGLEAGRFFLHRRGYKSERVRYTNLLILDRLKLDHDRPMIDYDEPRESLLIQHSMSRDLARRPHPDVRGWRPVFTKANSRLLEDAVLWIQTMMSQPRPEYPIDFEPPMLNGTADSPVEPDDGTATGPRTGR